jgi:hypothetical protein
VKKFIREYWVELLGLIAVLIAVILLLNRNNIWAIRVAGKGLISSISQWFNGLLDSAFGYLGRMSAAELLAWLLIFSGTVIILYRMRRRYLKSDHWQATVCPKCSSKLHRVHRTRLDRLLGPIFLPNSARYRCSNSSCRWSGLRQGRATQAGLHSRDTSSTRS